MVVRQMVGCRLALAAQLKHPAMVPPPWVWMSSALPHLSSFFLLSHLLVLLEVALQDCAPPAPKHLVAHKMSACKESEEQAVLLQLGLVPAWPEVPMRPPATSPPWLAQLLPLVGLRMVPLAKAHVCHGARGGAFSCRGWCEGALAAACWWCA